MKQLIILTLFFNWTISIYGQNQSVTSYSLKDCIEIALQNNLDLNSASLRAETANINFKQSKNELLPSLNGFYNIGKSSGRSTDPFTNSIVTQDLTFSNAGLRLNAVVFNGFKLINDWKRQKLNLLASKMEKEEARQNLVLNVTLTYLQVMNNKDLYELATNRLESTNQQLERLESLYDEEVGNPAEYRDFEGLRANDKANLITARNNFKDAKLSLKELMNIDSDFDLQIVDIPLDILDYKTSTEEVYQSALQNFAMVKADELRVDVADKGIAVARSLYMPEISIFANLNTNYSSTANLFNEGATTFVETGDFVTINGDDFPVMTERTEFFPQSISYRDQFENNLSQSYGIAVNLPLFNGFRTKNNVQLEKIKKEEAQTELERTKLQLKNAIDIAYRDMIAAYERYEVIQTQVNAYEESLRINEIRFNSGVNNSVDYIISKNNYDNALINFNNAKYEIVLRVKILEYYKGNL